MIVRSLKSGIILTAAMIIAAPAFAQVNRVSVVPSMASNVPLTRCVAPAGSAAAAVTESTELEALTPVAGEPPGPKIIRLLIGRDVDLAVGHDGHDVGVPAEIRPL